MSDTTDRKQWQPIHPDFLPKLLPEYVAHHNATTLWGPSCHQIPWDPAIRLGPPVIGGSTPLKVGGTKDISLGKFKVRVFTPEGDAPEGGWPKRSQKLPGGSENHLQVFSLENTYCRLLYELFNGSQRVFREPIN